MVYKNLKVVGARCIIKENPAEEVTKSGIVLTGTSAVEKPNTGTVLVVGEGAYLENGNIKPMTVKVGDTVMFAKYTGTALKYKNEEFIILNERDILVIVGKEDGEE